ncbi:hypothetical protein [Breoghania sp.]|uniref:hypothetical protein n=1 Tax=Breoghania sp. TaxID=2065378 RepID=UPI0029C9EBFC|nr:hypothetical protein [Breoghania sp.]
MALQNRVTPEGEIIATHHRGMFMGNRGGRIHDRETRTLTTRRFVSRRWICCETCFRSRRRDVMGEGYTELFFLDEPTALAAGHRPCFECRREAATHFQLCWQLSKAWAEKPRADEMDMILHDERLAPPTVMPLSCLPDGTALLLPGSAGMVEKDMTCDRIALIRAGHLLPWRAEGYGQAQPLPSDQPVSVLTPPSILAVLRQGYRPRWHPSAG